MELNEINTTEFQNAIKSLQSALKVKEPNELEKDGILQRFEFTFELSWKYIKKVLTAFGRTNVSSSPKPLIRDGAEENLIEDVALWLGFLEARNMSTHLYSESRSREVIELAKRFLPEAEKLLKKINELIKNRNNEQKN